jgi:hypothetical protein
MSRTSTTETCPRDDCNAEIINTDLAEVGHARSRDPRTEPVAECAAGHTTLK